MPPIPTDSILMVTIEGRHEGQQVLSVFTYNLVAETTLPNMDAAINKFWDKFNALDGMLDKYTACLSEKVTNIRTKLQWVAPDRYAFRTKVSGEFTQGQIVGSAYPVNTAITLTKRTDLAGRAQVGTLHMPGVPITALTDGVLLAPALARYEALGTKMLQNITTVDPDATYVPTLFHRSSPTVTIPITAFETARFARIMRRRTVGLGS